MLGFTIGRVHGNSMLPRIAPDSFILCSRRLFFHWKVGCVYYIQHAIYGRIVKTLAAIDGDSLLFCGENADSISSSAIGRVSKSSVIGRVLWVISPPN